MMVMDENMKMMMVMFENMKMMKVMDENMKMVDSIMMVKMVEIMDTMMSTAVTKI